MTQNTWQFEMYLLIYCEHSPKIGSYIYTNIKLQNTYNDKNSITKITSTTNTHIQTAHSPSPTHTPRPQILYQEIGCNR